ncbi:hypothetical protein PHYBOEH_005325 [Phytophthora boehmeriae]|uniref:Glycoside hydrolase 131 catalytic N-terminal domain-containing protein n=1 Tax=Phytophthora boehmeriae TaxID=109152 RepID=A0A8T1X3J9_9STRA|nr:hypothetical protein PHYBOEH_005325 [Phytophthora boehmeriae]
MQISTALLGLAAFTSLSVPPLAAEGKPLPWDGRGNDLVEALLDDKYNTEILTQRNGKSNGVPGDYVTIQSDGRSPAYNGDSGVIKIGVDSDAIYGTDKTARRSELVQTITANPAGTTFFRASIMKDKAFKYSLGWKVIFPQSNLFDIHVDAATDMPKVIFLTNDTEKAHWTSRIKVDTWYNFGIRVLPSDSGDGTKIEFYTSTGDEDLVLNVTTEVDMAVPTSYDMHYGLFTQTKSKAGPLMTTNQEIMAFNGVSVESEVVTAATVDVSDDSGSATSTASDVGEESGLKVIAF